MIRVALVDDHALIRQGLWRAIERAKDMSPVGEARSVREAEAMIRHVKPDVAVLDIRLPDGNGLELCSSLRDQDLVTAIVVLSMYGDAHRVLAARDAGASVFVSKDAPASHVVEAIRVAHASPASFSAEGLAEAIASESARRATLTSREGEVLALLAEGLSVSGIATRLFISESTAKTHISKIYAKLNANNRAQALMTALDLGLIQRDDVY
jgi:DNA-binding NarL/FixJ family response regulator